MPYWCTYSAAIQRNGVPFPFGAFQSPHRFSRGNWQRCDANTSLGQGFFFPHPARFLTASHRERQYSGIMAPLRSFSGTRDNYARKASQIVTCLAPPVLEAADLTVITPSSKDTSSHVNRISSSGRMPAKTSIATAG